MASEPSTPGLDPLEHVPIMWYHLNEIYMALNAAYVKSGAEDLVQTQREGKMVATPSKLTTKLERAVMTVYDYLGLGVDEETARERIPEI